MQLFTDVLYFKNVFLKLTPFSPFQILQHVLIHDIITVFCVIIKWQLPLTFLEESCDCWDEWLDKHGMASAPMAPYSSERLVCSVNGQLVQGEKTGQMFQLFAQVVRPNEPQYQVYRVGITINCPKRVSSWRLVFSQPLPKWWVWMAE